MLTKITTHLEKNTIRKHAQKSYKSTHQYYSFYTRFPWWMWAFGSREKLILKRQSTCSHALNERRLTSWWGFCRKYRADTGRKKTRTRHVFVHKIIRAGEASLICKSSSPITTLHSFTRTWIFDRSSTIEGVNVIKITITKTNPLFGSWRFVFRLGNFNKTTVLSKKLARKDMNFTDCYSYFLRRHAD